MSDPHFVGSELGRYLAHFGNTMKRILRPDGSWFRPDGAWEGRMRLDPLSIRSLEHFQRPHGVVGKLVVERPGVNLGIFRGGTSIGAFSYVNQVSIVYPRICWPKRSRSISAVTERTFMRHWNPARLEWARTCEPIVPVLPVTRIVISISPVATDRLSWQ